MRRAPLVFFVFALLFALLVSGCVTRKELGPRTMEHMLSDCAVLAMCERDAECSEITFDGILLTEFQAEQCVQAELITNTVQGRRTNAGPRP